MNPQLQDCIVYVIDDDEALLQSVEWLLKSVPFNVECYPSAKSFLEIVKPKSLGCVITDLRMPEMNGIELHQALKDRGIDLPVVVMTAHGQVTLAVEAIKQGVVDFIEKPFDDQRFIDIINSALRMCIERAEDREKNAMFRQRYAQLTPREQQVCQLVAEGHTNKTISKSLGISEKTVEAHRAQVMHKMEVSSLAQLIRALFQADPQLAEGND